MRKLAIAMLLLAACGGDDDSESAPDAAATADAAELTWTAFAQPFFETYCYECHGPGDTQRDYSDIAMVRAEATRIRAGVESGQFPIGSGPFPSQAERIDLIAWIDLGTPE